MKNVMEKIFLYDFILLYKLLPPWRRSLGRRSGATRLLGLRVRVLPSAKMSVCCGIL